ncbi:MAG: hypothetical protein MJZ93_05270 [Paludibacteraceae bacterium]|nr:hypothetical protein [Paludibacteraceae bacterium]
MKAYSYLCLIATSVLLLCCNSTYGKIDRKSTKKSTVKNVMKVQVDDSVKHYLGDSISKIIFEADTIELFSLSVTPPLDTLDSVTPPSYHGCYIKHKYGVLSKAESYPILLILSDRENYFPDGVRLKSPFTPSVALSFKKGNTIVDIVFSFTGGQMLIFMQNEDEMYYKYTYERLIMKYFLSFLQDERISEYLNL